VNTVQRYRRQAENFLAVPAARQFVRYVIAGLCVTQFAACIYSVLVLYFAMHPLEANLVSTSVGIGAGYVAHSRWSFAGGAADGEYGKITRFLVTSLTALAVNSTWVWLLVSVLKLPPLSPVPLMICVTPWISFLLNRRWVFRAA
jgi:putative flippase GtrA